MARLNIPDSDPVRDNGGKRRPIRTDGDALLVDSSVDPALDPKTLRPSSRGTGPDAHRPVARGDEEALSSGVEEHGRLHKLVLTR